AGAALLRQEGKATRASALRSANAVATASAPGRISWTRSCQQKRVIARSASRVTCPGRIEREGPSRGQSRRREAPSVEPAGLRRLATYGVPGTTLVPSQCCPSEKYDPA